MILRGSRWAWDLVRQGHTKFLFAEVWMRLYKEFQEAIFFVKYQLGRGVGPKKFDIKIETDHPIAFESPDHLVPWGTGRDNSTNKKFVMHMAKLIKQENQHGVLGALDLGCSGGQLVRDFRDLGWLAVGLEGSDFSLKHKRANWPELAGQNLFTCDITKPFRLKVGKEPARFHLITAWEVLEHIRTEDLTQLFTNIVEHLEPGGYFVASTTSHPDIHDGIDLHQTKWTNEQWKTMLAENFPDLAPINLGLRFYQYVRHNEEGSFLTFRKTPTRLRKV